MMKKYEMPEIQVENFQVADILTTSTPNHDNMTDLA